MNSDTLAKIFTVIGMAALAFAVLYMILAGFVFAGDTEDPFSYCFHNNEFPYNMLCAQQAIYDSIDDVLNLNMTK